MKKLTYKYLTKNMLLFLIPLCIPILILGVSSITISKSYNEQEIDKSNMNLLMQTKTNIELIFSEMDSLNLNFGTNPEIVVSLKRIFKSTKRTLEDYQMLKTIRNFIDAPANARPYIHSIYVYFENEEKNLIATTQDGFVKLDKFHDKSWYQSFMSRENHTAIWTELRQIKAYDFEEKPIRVLTLYRNLGPVDTAQKVGVIVLNINLKYIEDLLNQLETSSRQAILVVDGQGNIVLKNSVSYNFAGEDLKSFIDQGSQSHFKVKTPQDTFIVSQLSSGRYDWRYISITPENILYKVSYQIQQLTTIMLVFSFLLGLMITFYLNKRNDRRIQDIITIIDSAKDDAPLPALNSTIRDEFSYILNNLLITFIEQKYLKVQLSERKYHQRFAELLALQSQINPHFLFNSLQTIYWKVQQFTGKPNEANKMLQNLSDILKYSLEDPGTPVTIGDEISNAKNYLDIQKIRYKNNFEVIWEYDEGVESYKAMRLLLQPLIENSIYHGIKKKEGNRYIKIKIHNRQKYLKISVIDNGMGMKADTVEQIRSELQQDRDYSSHIGLFNTNKRLKLVYGEESDIQIRSKYGIGTAVYIKLPAL